MRRLWPAFACRVDGGLLACTGPLQPTSLTARYRVQLRYRVGDSPKIEVLHPRLRPLEPGGHIPHVYGEDRPCLYLPGTDEWRPDKYLATTMIPWCMEWLVFYEAWRVTGEWLGGGVHPTPKPKPVKER